MFHRPENVRKLCGKAVDTVAAGEVQGDEAVGWRRFR
ncbi:hypothetical protein P296_21715 [Salmonella enterica subsp. arizonae serovar 18:z4,z23:- str. CVM N26624]|uniref:Uncharacterized protein n=3 Tax=Salmonella enterica subsp. arizonae TaxID=59203 RepID=A9MLW0_SALAR|nr:hypothetical protein SARI_00908 [Salmonella enterica subsp. arizonae serovar 62:z4,z23:-]AIP97307.1 hypothetical protein N898_04505 [Salmonella enterica subsp. arizonae serovar 62:z36:- str. RKS2983]OLV93520.1 hypothetical protein P298_22340 [Salmonella enterica subsp. arizonae serovar 18:z4,z23:- str. CVM N26626]OLV93651.1 hypothetical protein P296_21715 [Salmonella enterica subsp. arizonae serovar 18:z4,z23:- str. CVM N26624]OLV94666.1 hypothetical protein P297_21130 [Salmonella enterica s